MLIFLEWDLHHVEFYICLWFQLLPGKADCRVIALQQISLVLIVVLDSLVLTDFSQGGPAEEDKGLVVVGHGIVLGGGEVIR